MRVDEVAMETGVAIGTVKARLSRGRAALRTILGDIYDGDRTAEGPGGGSWAYAVRATPAAPLPEPGRLRVGAWAGEHPQAMGGRHARPELAGRDD